jgi:hypothetical protein
MVSKANRKIREDRIEKMVAKLKIDDVQPKTIRQHARLLKKLYEIIHSRPWTYNTFSWLKDISDIEDAIKKDPKWKAVNTRKAVFIALAFITRYLNPTEFKTTQEYYSKQASEIERKRKGKKMYNLTPAMYLEDCLTWPQVLELKNAADEAGGVWKVIYHLYTDMPPRRVQDFARMKIGKLGRGRTYISKLPSDANYLLLNARGTPTKMVFKKYKGKALASRGVQVFPVPKSLQKVLKTYIADEDKETGDYLFTDADNATDRHDTKFGKMVIGTFLKLRGIDGSGITHKFGVNHLRHAYASYHIPRIDSEAEGEEIAKKMATSLATLRREYIFRDLRCF